MKEKEKSEEVKLEELKQTQMEEVDELRNLIDQLARNVRQVKNLYSHILASPIKDDEQQQKLDEVTAETTHLSGKIRLAIHKLEHDLQKTQGTPGAATHGRMMKTQISILSKKCQDLTTDLNIAQVDFREKRKRLIQKQLQIAGNPFDEDQLDEMLDNPQVSSGGVFTQGILMDTQTAKKALTDIQERHEEVVKLESDIVDLNQMFVELTNLVDQQGDMVDSIEMHVNQAADDIEAAAPQLRSAERSAWGARKKQVCIAIILVIVIIVLALIIYFALK